jgi:Kef-type K+ transport system membrane component KefB
MSKLTLAILLFFTGQSLIWFQTNGQFIWKWFDKHPILLSVGLGSVISYMFIVGTKLMVGHFDGLLWPGRFMGFALGISSYAVLTWYFMGEGITLKTLTSLILSAGIICVQLFWKSA